MGMSVKEWRLGSRSRRRGGGMTLSEINVTPFVDVVLVLLIIFMLTAHVMDFGIEVDVPHTTYVKETTVRPADCHHRQDRRLHAQRAARQYS